MNPSGYRPDFLNDDSRRNIGCLFDFHASQKNGKDYAIGHQTGEFYAELAEEYDLDDIVVGGDVESYDALSGFLEGVDNVDKVWIIEGDEDRKKKTVGDEPVAGWRYQSESEEPFDVDVDYSFEGRSLEMQPFEYDIWMQHEYKDIKNSDDLLFNIDRLKDDQHYHPQDLPPEFEDPVIAVHGHNHQPLPMTVNNAGVSGIGSWRNNHETTALMPDSSYNILSFGEKEVDNLHFDRETGELFEHHKFELEDGKFEKTYVEGQEENELTTLQRFTNIPNYIQDSEDFTPTAAD